MLKIENTEVLGWEHAIRGMRNPMNSWEKSDSSKRGRSWISQSRPRRRGCTHSSFGSGLRADSHKAGSPQGITYPLSQISP